MSHRGHLGLIPVLKWRLFQVASAAVRVAPGLVQQASPLAGDVAWLVAVRQRRAVARNVAFIEPAAGSVRIRSLSRAVFRSVARYYVELLRLPYTEIDELHGRIDVTGWENFAAANERGAGVIVASLHYGPAEIVLQAFGGRGIRYTAMIERIRPIPLAKLFLCLREAHGNQYVFPGRAGARQLIRALKSGGVVALMVDRDVTGGGMHVTFCGGTVSVPAGPVELAHLTGAAIIPAIGRWRPHNRYEVTLLPAVIPEPDRRKPKMLRVEIEAVLAELEPYLRREPEQWIVLLPLWNERMPGVSPAYTGVTDRGPRSTGGAVGDS